MNPVFRYVRSVAELPDFSGVQNLCLDFETLSGTPEAAEAAPWKGARIALLAIGDADGDTVYVVATKRCKRESPELPCLDTQAVLAWLRATLAQPRCSLVGHWIRAEAHLARADGCPLRRDATWFCTEIVLHHENDCLEEYNLKWAADNIVKFPMLREKQEILLNWLVQSKMGTRKHPGDFAEVPTALLGVYCACDVWATILLRRWELQNLDQQQMRAVHQDLEVNKIFTDMQYRGVRLDIVQLMRAKYWYIHEELAMSEMCVLITGKEFNPLSGPHLISLLIVHYKLPVVKWTKPKGSDPHAVETPSFDEEAMQLYAQMPEVREGKIPGLESLLYCIGRCREVSKILGYIDGLLDNAPIKIGPDGKPRQGGDGRVHGSIHPCRARGGRTTSNDPNLQNFPPEVKQYLLPDPGYGFFNADASQIEYRFMAHYMRDPRLLEGFRDRKFDQHEAVRAWMGLPDRDLAKVFNFGIAFNMGAAKIARTYAIQMRAAKDSRAVTLDDGIAVFKRYTAELPALLPTRRAFESAAKARGYVRNVFGRKAYLPPDKAYKAFNRGNQGGAADLVKNRMIELDRRLREEGLSDVVLFDLMVHDELLLEVLLDPTITRRAIEVVLDVLEGFAELRVVFYWDSAFVVGSWYDVAVCKKDKKARPAKKAAIGKHTVKFYSETRPGEASPANLLEQTPNPA